MEPARFDNIFFARGKRELFTRSKGDALFDEKIVVMDGVSCRSWDPKRSKLGAAIMKGASQIGIREGSIVLYLGAAHGYTPSFVSDIIGEAGMVFALDFAPRVVKDLIHVCEQRQNMVPLLGDASNPRSYLDRLCLVDVVYQDIAQRLQTRIFLDNCRLFLKPDGYGLFAVKARSIDVARNPDAIFKEVALELAKELVIVDQRRLDPFEKDHIMFICKKR
ncbi:MAG: fibrillarin-like rRNA/tRNA 2'-O-methyltransferase [DPANN group archaeon]|nr:fibrillarin-like rRNA/tRNA 2'-O-methyltransferase [DPANN group archaeon]